MSNKFKKREEVDNKYKWDLTPIYKDVESFEKDILVAQELIENFSSLKDDMMNSSKNLLLLIKKDQEIDKLLNHLYMYAHLNKDSDTTNQKYQEMYEKVYNLMVQYDEVASFIIPTLLKYDYSKIEEFYNECEELLEYKFLFKKIYREKEHILTQKEEKIISSFGSSFDFPEKVYDMFTNAELKFPTIKDEVGKDVELTDSNYSVYIKSKNRNVRKEAFELLHKGYAKYKNSISLMLSNAIKVNNTISKVRNYNSSLEKALFIDNIDTSVYNNLVNTVEKNLDILHKYLTLKKEVLNLEDLHLYDVYVPLINEYNKTYTFEEGKDLVKKALEVLGADYQKVLNKAFDEKWIDIYPNVGKVSGAYSSGSYTTYPYILLNYQDQLNDVSTLAHELGHSIHSYYSRKNNPYQYHSYKIFVAEVASTVNELLLSKYMLKNSTSDKEKLSILNKLMELFRTTIYRQTMFASFEKEIYEKEQNGIILTSDEICNTYYKLNKKYFGNDTIVDDEIRYEWEKVPHFYYNFYVFKYATGLSAACYIVNRIMNNEENAVDDYLNFLKTGGSDYPIEELKVAGVDMTKKEVIESAINMFNDTLEEFKNLYNKLDKE